MDLSPQTRKTKVKTNQCDLMKLKTFVYAWKSHTFYISMGNPQQQQKKGNFPNERRYL